MTSETACIAVPSSSGVGLEWKTPAQCVWGDDEFSQNGLVLESKIAVREIVEQHAPSAKPFFFEILSLQNAGIHELLADLALMQQKNSTNLQQAHRLYERIESHRRAWPKTIKFVRKHAMNGFADLFGRKAFRGHPLVLFRDIGDRVTLWLDLKECVWTRSVLRSKHALAPSLNQYRNLFRDTLEVPNASMDMLVSELLHMPRSAGRIPCEDYKYTKELVQEIARLQRGDVELKRLDGQACWPCADAIDPAMRSIGEFYVNDRADLFNLFNGAACFLDFDFDTSKKLADLLHFQGCNMFLSTRVKILTESCEPLHFGEDFTQEFRARADALIRYADITRGYYDVYLTHSDSDTSSMPDANHLTNFDSFSRTLRSQ